MSARLLPAHRRPRSTTGWAVLAVGGAHHRAVAGPLRSLVLIVTLVLALTLTGCTDDPPPEPVDVAGADLVVVGRDNLQWDVEELTATAGEIRIALVCEDAVNHNLVIRETGEEVAVCAPGRTDIGTVTLEPGEYTYVCTVPGHERTMQGTLTVVADD